MRIQITVGLVTQQIPIQDLPSYNQQSQSNDHLKKSSQSYTSGLASQFQNNISSIDCNQIAMAS